MTRNLLALPLLAAALLLTACNSTQTAADELEDKEKCLAPKPGTITTVNATCAIVHEDPVDPSVATAEWRGQKVGFCCNGCIRKWEKLTPAEKDQALAAAAPNTRNR